MKFNVPGSHRKSRRQAFTLAELMITVAVIGVIALGGVYASSQVIARRDFANTAAAELVGWLDAISSRSGSVGPCRVQFTTGNALEPGATFASLQTGDARCTPEPNLRLPSVYGNRVYDVAVTYTPVGTTSLAFTPRGGVVAGNVEATVKIAVSNQLPLRCVRISFGSISTGINNTTGNVAQTCTVWERT